MPNPPIPTEPVEVTTGGFGVALIHHLGLDPHEVLVGGFRVEFTGDTATVTYQGIKRLPAAEVQALMAENGVTS